MEHLRSRGLGWPLPSCNWQSAAFVDDRRNVGTVMFGASLANASAPFTVKKGEASARTFKTKDGRSTRQIFGFRQTPLKVI